MRIDGTDLRDVQLRSFRRQLGVVLQDPFLFSGTIADNIRFGRPEATDEEVARRGSTRSASTGSRRGSTTGSTTSSARAVPGCRPASGS